MSTGKRSLNEPWVRHMDSVYGSGNQGYAENAIVLPDRALQSWQIADAMQASPLLSEVS